MLNDSFPKYDFYPLLKTKVVNAKPYENPDAYPQKVPNRLFRKARSVISLRGPQLPGVFSEGDFYLSSENADGKCGTIRKFRRTPFETARSALSENRRRNSP